MTSICGGQVDGDGEEQGGGDDVGDDDVGGGDDDGGGAGIANNHGAQLSNSENTLFCQYQACRAYV